MSKLHYRALDERSILCPVTPAPVTPAPAAAPVPSHGDVFVACSELRAIDMFSAAYFSRDGAEVGDEVVIIIEPGRASRVDCMII